MIFFFKSFAGFNVLINFKLVFLDFSLFIHAVASFHNLLLYFKLKIMKRSGWFYIFSPGCIPMSSNCCITF